MMLFALIWLEAHHQVCLRCFQAVDGERSRFASWETTRRLDPWVHKWMKT
jgi:hypothetical protein